MTSDWGFAILGISSSFGAHGFTLLRLNSSGDYYDCVLDLRKGENRIGLETGVYLWTAGNQKGKLSIR
ncbi:MAG: hypothetical protein ABIM88_01350 [candidate division WOR-3 bacterium]